MATIKITYEDGVNKLSQKIDFDPHLDYHSDIIKRRVNNYIDKCVNYISNDKLIGKDNA